MLQPARLERRDDGMNDLFVLTCAVLLCSILTPVLLCAVRLLNRWLSGACHLNMMMMCCDADVLAVALA